ncbi:hypothetical protein B0H13DRAFT_1920965 [Mycena leptocephala]|nr:hypothetical protein B0H13DRAFT_1920965 [Mycena leptocephala]
MTWANIIAHLINQSAHQKLSLTGIYEALCLEHPWFPANRSEKQLKQPEDDNTAWRVDYSNGQGQNRSSRAKRNRIKGETKNEIILRTDEEQAAAKAQSANANRTTNCFNFLSMAPIANEGGRGAKGAALPSLDIVFDISQSKMVLRCSRLARFGSVANYLTPPPLDLQIVGAPAAARK